MLQFADLRFADHIPFATFDFSICDPIFFADLKLRKSANTHFSPYKYKLKMFLVKFNNDFWLLGQF
jgi:hypothetical protein